MTLLKVGLLESAAGYRGSTSQSFPLFPAAVTSRMPAFLRARMACCAGPELSSAEKDPEIADTPCSGARPQQLRCDAGGLLLHRTTTPRACRQSAMRPATPLQTLYRLILTIFMDNSVTTAAPPTSFWQRE